MSLTDAEQQFLDRQVHGHLATIDPGGLPQVKPLGFTYNASLGTIDISGYRMGSSAKYRNVRSNPHRRGLPRQPAGGGRDLDLNLA